MFKKIIVLLLFISQFVFADFVKSDSFEPTMGCAAGGLFGYLSDQDGDSPIMTGATYCAVGGLVGYALNKYMKPIVIKRNVAELDLIKAKNLAYEQELMNHAIKGDTDINYGVISEEHVKGLNLKGRGVMSPTKIIKISR